MPKQAFVSMSDLAWDAAGNPDFEKLRVGYTGVLPDGRKYVVKEGVPVTAKLNMVLYVYEDESVPENDNVFDTTPTLVTAEYAKNET